MFKLYGPNKTCPWAKTGPQLPSVRSVEGIFSRKESWKTQNKHPASLAVTCLNQESTQDQLAELGGLTPRGQWLLCPTFGLDGGGEGGCQEGFILEEKDHSWGARGHKLGVKQLGPGLAGPQREHGPSLASASSRPDERECWAPDAPTFCTEALA